MTKNTPVGIGVDRDVGAGGLVGHTVGDGVDGGGDAGVRRGLLDDLAVTFYVLAGDEPGREHRQDDDRDESQQRDHRQGHCPEAAPAARRPRVRLDTAAAAIDGVINVCGCVSVNDLTIRAAIIAGLAIVALVLTGWRKTARATPKTSRGRPRRRARCRSIERRPTPASRPQSVQRLVALLASGGLALLVGAVIATVSAFAIAVIVTTMTNLLKD